MKRGIKQRRHLVWDREEAGKREEGLLSGNLARGILRRPLLLAATVLILMILISYYAGYFDLDGSAYSCADDRRLMVSGIVVGRECSVNGYRIIMDHLQFVSGTKEASSVYRDVTKKMNKALKPDDRIQVFLSNGQTGNITMYGEGEDASFWTNSAAQTDQTQLFERILIGDRVCFFGKCSQPDKATNPGQFDSRRYYLARRIILKMSEADLKELSRPSGCVFSRLFCAYRNVLADMRIGMQSGLISIFGSKDAAQIAAFTLNDKSGMDSESKQLYKDGGLTWLLCVSSLHISIIGMIVYRFLRKRGISFKVSSAAAFFLVNSYALLSGYSISSQRALITFAFWLGAQIFGRTRDTLSSLSGSAIVILIRQPYALWDSSFLLSFVCILSMEYLTPAFERILKPRFSFSRKICGSIGIRMGVLPVSLWFFYQTTPYAFAVLLVLLPLMSLLLGFALLGSVAGYALSVTGAGIFQLIGKCFAFPCHLLIMLMDLVCSVQQAIPGSVRILGRPDLWQVLVYYAGLVCFIITIKILNPSCFQKPGARSVYRNSAFHSTSSLSADVSGRSKAAERFLGLKGKVCALGKGIVKVPGLNRTRFISSLFLLMLILMLCFRVCPDYQFLCLDVGQGSCNLIRHGGNTYLFDAGSSSVRDVWQYRIDSTLKYYGISTLDMVFLSHGDMDHINGIEQMLELYRRNLIGRNAGDVTIDKILLPDLPQMDDRLAPIVDGAKEQGIVLDSVSAGDSFEQDNMKFSILDPSPGRMTGNSNEDCIVMMVTYKTLEILLMADLEKEGENMFVKDCPVERKQGTRILIAGHHGSKNATSDELLKVTDPDICFISCGKNNRYGHPALQMLERLQRAGVSWRRTDQEGAVGISF